MSNQLKEIKKSRHSKEYYETRDKLREKVKKVLRYRTLKKWNSFDILNPTRKSQ